MMKRLVDVHTGEVMAGSEETILHSDSHNRCMVICAYDNTKKVGGLAHAMFLSGKLNKKCSNSILRDAGGAIDEMIADMHHNQVHDGGEWHVDELLVPDAERLVLNQKGIS